MFFQIFFDDVQSNFVEYFCQFFFNGFYFIDKFSSNSLLSIVLSSFCRILFSWGRSCQKCICQIVFDRPCFFRICRLDNTEYILIKKFYEYFLLKFILTKIIFVGHFLLEYIFVIYFFVNIVLSNIFFRISCVECF